jgi:hypothetical protein
MISDVHLDGSISQLAVHRSEFHSILQREGVEDLVMALQPQGRLAQERSQIVIARAPRR